MIRRSGHLRIENRPWFTTVGGGWVGWVSKIMSPSSWTWGEWRIFYSKTFVEKLSTITCKLSSRAQARFAKSPETGRRGASGGYGTQYALLFWRRRWVHHYGSEISSFCFDRPTHSVSLLLLAVYCCFSPFPFSCCLLLLLLMIEPERERELTTVKWCVHGLYRIPQLSTSLYSPMRILCKRVV